MKIDKMHFTQTEVETALENLPLGKAKGPDGLGNLGDLKQLALKAYPTESQEIRDHLVLRGFL